MCEICMNVYVHEYLCTYIFIHIYREVACWICEMCISMNGHIHVYMYQWTYAMKFSNVSCVV